MLGRDVGGKAWMAKDEAVGFGAVMALEAGSEGCRTGRKNIISVAATLGRDLARSTCK